MSIKSYTLIRCIGEGGFGQVYLANKAGKERSYVAIKVQKKESVEKNNWTKRAAINEVEILKMAIGDKFIAQIKSAFVDLTGYYTVFDIYEGGDLYRFLKRPSYRPNKEIFCFVAMNLLIALEHLHKLGVIHNDFKPPNILIRSSGYLVISDFGLSIIGSHDSGRKGTPGYIAPECFKNEAYTNSADYFSLGIILFEISEKKLPYKDTNSMSVNKVSSYAISINKNVADFVSSLLEIDPRNGTCTLNKAKTFRCFERSDFSAIEQQTCISPLLEYVSKSPIIQNVERVYDFHPETPSSQKR